MVETELDTKKTMKSEGLVKIFSAKCVRNNEKKCNIFWPDAKC